MEQVKQRKTESLLSSLLKARLESERERERNRGFKGIWPEQLERQLSPTEIPPRAGRV